MRDFQAVLVAAGRGSRMTDLVSCDDFKCNIPIGNNPMLFYPLRNLKNAGFSEVTVVVPAKYKPDESVAEKLKLRLEYVHVNTDAEEQGTAESLRLIKDKIKPGRHLLMVSSDLVTDIDLSTFCLRQRVTDALLTVLLAPLPSQLSELPVPGSKKKFQPERDIIALEAETNRIVQFGAAADYTENMPIRYKLIRQFPNLNIFSDLLDCHVYAIHPQAIEYILNNRTLATFKGEVLPALVRKQFDAKDLKDQPRSPNDTFDTLRCYAVLSKGFALRANTVQAYKIANGEVRNIFNDLFPAGAENLFKDKPQIGHKAMLKKNVLGERVTVGPGCKIVSSVLHDDVKIGDGSVVQNSVICRGASVASRVNVINSFIGARAVVPEGKVIKDECFGISNMEFE